MSSRNLLSLLACLPAALSLAAADPEFRTGLFRDHVVTFQVVGGMAVFEGDIILGCAGELEAALRSQPRTKGGAKEASVVPGEQFRWKDGVIPYVVDPAIPKQDRIEDAVRHWNERTRIRMVPRTDEADFVRFVHQNSNGVCYSSIGRTGGQQTIRVDDACSLGVIVHEIGHTVGMWHEQSRHDRDGYIRVMKENIDPSYAGQFQQQILNGADVGPYDYGSIMHYSGGAFARGAAPSMVTIPLGIPIGQRSGLSAGDLDAVKRLYGETPSEVTVTTNPEGLHIVVDGETYTSPQSFRWAPGSVHKLAAPEIQDDRGTLRQVFARWSHDEDREHTVVARPGDTLYLANYARHVRFRSSTAPTEGGSVEVTPPSEEGWYPVGATLGVRAVPRPGYNFSGWTSVGRDLHGPAANPAVLSAAAYEYRANFTRSPVTTIATDPPGLTVTVNNVPYLSPVAFTWTPGSVHTVAVAAQAALPRDADRRFLFREWSDGGERERQVTAGGEPAAITARFRTQHRISVQTAPRMGGAATLEPLSPDGFYDEGAVLQVKAVPAEPYKFFGWSGQAPGGSLEATHTVAGEAVVVANFSVPRQIDRRSIFNAASLDAGPLCPGCAFSIFGVELGPETPAWARLGPDGRLATDLGGTRVLVDGIPAPLLYVSAHQVNALVPFALAGRASVEVRVETAAGPAGSASVPLADAQPALFTTGGTGAGQGAILNEDYALNGPEFPARRGSVIMLFGTGLGPMAPEAVDGMPAGYPAPLVTLPVEARIGGRRALVEFAGAAPGLPMGVYQVNVRVPDGISTEEPAVVLLKAGNRSTTRGVTLSVE
jgi:uncharacterized protein (TIGR03437 family)